MARGTTQAASAGDAGFSLGFTRFLLRNHTRAAGGRSGRAVSAAEPFMRFSCFSNGFWLFYGNRVDRVFLARWFWAETMVFVRF